MLDIDKLNEFTQNHGELRRGQGWSPAPSR